MSTSSSSQPRADISSRVVGRNDLRSRAERPRDDVRKGTRDIWIAARRGATSTVSMLTIALAPMSRAFALVILAWALLRTLVAPLFGGRRGLAGFRQNYAADRLPPVSGTERGILIRAGGCVACGLCDAGEGAAIVRSKGAYAGVMDLMLASSR